MSSKVNNGPEESWNPLIFLEANQLKEVLNEKKNSFKSDLSQQNIFLKTDCVNEASGSSYIEIGNTKVLCSVYGPREIPRKDDYDFEIANLNCEIVKLSPWLW